MGGILGGKCRWMVGVGLLMAASLMGCGLLPKTSIEPAYLDGASVPESVSLGTPLVVTMRVYEGSYAGYLKYHHTDIKRQGTQIILQPMSKVTTGGGSDASFRITEYQVPVKDLPLGDYKLVVVAKDRSFELQARVVASQ